jgi:uncharacterized phage protein gp47/JayE
MATFQLKSFTSIVAAMLNHVRGTAPELTDFNVGAVNRVMLEAPATEIDEAYQQIFNGLRAAIPVATYQSFNFGRLPAAPTTGVLHVVLGVSAVDVTIPAGQVFSTPGSSLTYLSQAAVTIIAGASAADVSVVASGPGSLGNLPAGQAFAATPAIANFVSATNVLLLNDGRDLESDDERKQRFTSYIQTIQRGTDAALIYGARTCALFNSAGVEVERVRAVGLIEPYLADNTQPISWIQIYVHNGVGATSSDLVALVDKVLRGYTDPATGAKIPGWKAAGTKLDTAAAAEVKVNLTGALTVSPGYVAADLATAADSAAEALLLGLDCGATLQLQQLVLAVSAIPGVANFVIQACAATLWGTSVTSLATAPGSKTFVTQAGLTFAAGQLVQAFRTAAPATRMLGTVTSYSGTSLVCNMVAQEGVSGTYTDWNVTLVDPVDVTCLESQKLMPGAVAISGA